ncbi:DEAD/DEAH box helicase [Bordetella bronchialis]|uniref:RNA helicase n=1 Tax=Bordetella bronchialis TaxID=463025 RepID=A0A193G3Z9_9BORD|nr:DEAD/DEAH box helicase [Bordetella bronchialis]ANN74181.1 RNA helicase [Bordetella bronchialis]
MSFESLGLAPTLLSALQEAGFDTPTSVQAAAIPQAMAGHDLMVSSQTGSGKTAAFMLPALHRVAQMPANKGTGVQVLVLTPTRELALQVNDATRQYGKNLRDLRTATVVGGMPYGVQLKALSRRVDVLVATPGRLIDHLQSGRVKLNTVHTLVLDEADRMLDMGFIEDIETIVGRLPEDRQTLLFSATLDGTVAKLAAKMMREPQRIEIAGQKDKHSNITQSLLYADDAAHKMQLLDHVLRDAALDQAIVFTATKRGADDLADRLADQGFAAAALHGDMNQRQRTRTLSMLQRRQLKVLVATDVAARGIDVQGISHAVNFDLPMQAEDYVHRIGRTGRAGRDGLAFTLATHAERHKIRRIEHFIGQTLTPQVIAGLEPKRTPRPFERGSKPGFGKRPFNRDSRGGFGARGFEDRPRRDGRDGAAPQQREFSGDRPQRGWRDGDRGFQGGRPYAGEGASRPAERGFDPAAGFRGDRGPAADRGFRGDRAPRDGDRPQRAEGGFRAPRPEGGFRPQRQDAGFRPARSEGGMRADKAAREGNGGSGRSTEGYARPTGRPAFEKRDGRPGKPFKPAYAGRRD